MEPSRPGASPVGEPRRFPVGPVVFGVIVAVVAVWITVAAVTHRDPEETVEDYLTAIAEKDVAGALELVSRFGYGVPYGDDAVFLTPEAISDDWWVESVTEIDREYSSTARVKAVIAGPGGTAESEFVVSEDDDEWLMSDPFVRVQFPGSPLSYIQVNDKIVPRARDYLDYQSYILFPGLYRFYQSVPDVVGAPKTDAVMAFPPESSAGRNESVVVPSALTAGTKTVEEAQLAVRNRIDECAGFATPAPNIDCPFATDGEIDTPDGRRVTGLHSLKWTVETYPEVAMADDRSNETVPGFVVSAREPGTVALSGSGVDTDGNPAMFAVTCAIDLNGVVATIDADGNVNLSVSDQLRTVSNGYFNTCQRNP